MSLAEYVTVFRRSWILFLALVIVGGGAGAALSYLSTPRYSASASVYFSLSFGNSANDLNQGSTYTQSQMQSFAILARSPAVLQRVIRDLGLEMSPQTLASSISVATPQDTVVLEVTATSRSAGQAAEIANSVARDLDAEVQENAPKNEDGDSTVSTRIISPAFTPLSASSPNTRLNILAGLLLGLVLAAITVLLRHTLDNRVSDTAALARVTPLPLLGSFEKSPLLTAGNLVLIHEPTSTVAESFRQLRSNVQFAALDTSAVTVMVTSSVPGEGKSVTAGNLALAMAESESSVVLVDLDLRRPRIARYFGLEESLGLSNVLLGQASLDDVIQSGGHPSLDVIAAGFTPSNPGVMLASPSLIRLLHDLRDRYDVVIIDSAPVLAAADAPALAREAHGVIVVVDSTTTKRNQLQLTLDNLEASGANIFGVALNKLPRARWRYEYYSAPQADPHETPPQTSRSFLDRFRRRRSPLKPDVI